MSGDEFVERVFLNFGAKNVFEIAEKVGVKIVYQKWFPVTLGEFDWRTKTIIVNENAPIPLEKIVAHELGHYFLKEFKIENVADEESFCDEFAVEMLDRLRIQI
ncbi:MAG: ImmA/IrrE family metallo-endopeptidase [Pyrinomonadaceae bacterium]|nr:ImmA/IrrE family metallo-endopeptidase [Pyrinomonadaceae bacterium]